MSKPKPKKKEKNRKSLIIRFIGRIITIITRKITTAIAILDY